jgi:hypothetical protein
MTEHRLKNGVEHATLPEELCLDRQALLDLERKLAAALIAVRRQLGKPPDTATRAERRGN